MKLHSQGVAGALIDIDARLLNLRGTHYCRSKDIEAAELWNEVIAGQVSARTGAPVVTVAERLRPERLYERFLAYRADLGIEILPLTGGGTDLVRTLTGHLRAGRLVPLLADRDLRASGIDVTFFGEATKMPPGPALLALQSGAALHPSEHPLRAAWPRRGGLRDRHRLPRRGTAAGERQHEGARGDDDCGSGRRPRVGGGRITGGLAHGVALWLVDLGERAPR